MKLIARLLWFQDIRTGFAGRVTNEETGWGVTVLVLLVPTRGSLLMRSGDARPALDTTGAPALISGKGANEVPIVKDSEGAVGCR